MKLSVIVVAYEMARELPRTIQSLSPLMQCEIDAADYEVIVVDNGSMHPADLSNYQDKMQLRSVLVPPHEASPSPASVLNAALAQAQGDLIGVMIDGARIASPGLLASARRADRLDERGVILSLAFHLGAKPQMASVLEGYDQSEEDRLLDGVHWSEDGYRLFDISVFAGSSKGGWFETIAESNALFMRKVLWEELAGFDERFTTPGGGLVNLDMLSRAVNLPDTRVVTLLGEGTFHQVHGGVATNALEPVQHRFFEEYAQIRGRPYQRPVYETVYVGRLRGAAQPSVARSLRESGLAGPVDRGPSDRYAWRIDDSLSGLRDDHRPSVATPDALFVLGMHRSGTSALAGVLCQLGFALPGEAIALAPDNPKGHFESEWVRNLNERFLRRLGSGWDDPLPLRAHDWLALRMDDLQALIDDNLAKAFATSSFLVLKDPRLCLLAPIWMDAVARAGRQAAFVLPVRHPAEVAQSLLARDGILPAHSFAIWLKHVLSSERATRGYRRCAISFSQLLNDCDRTLDAIAAKLELAWPIDTASGNASSFVEPELRHHRAATLHPDVAIEALCGQAWEAFQVLMIDDTDAEAIQVLDRISQRFQDAGALLSPLLGTRTSVLEPAAAPHLDGMRIQVPNRPEVWLIFHGMRHHIASSYVYDALFSSMTNLHSMPTVDHILRGPDLSDGACLIRGAGTPDIFLLVGTDFQGVRKHRIRSWTCFQEFDFDIAKVRDLPSLALAGIPEGRPLD